MTSLSADSAISQAAQWESRIKSQLLLLLLTKPVPIKAGEVMHQNYVEFSPVSVEAIDAMVEQIAREGRFPDRLFMLGGNRNIVVVLRDQP